MRSFVLLATLLGGATLATPARCGPSFPLANGDKLPVIEQRDIVFGTGDDVELRLDLAQPARGDGPFPLVVCVHGGSWQFGHRLMHYYTIRWLASHGYVAASVEYRFAPRYRFPAQVEDVKCAVRFLRTNAKKYKIDPARVGALGESAGGHLVLLLGLMDPGDGMEGQGGSAGPSSKVQAVVNICGPTDFSTWKPSAFADVVLRLTLGKDSNALLHDLLDTADRKDPKMKVASPLTYVDAKDAAVLTFQGTADSLVPPQQARLLHTALKKAGVEERLELLAGAGHGWGPQLRERTDRLTLEFFDKHLKRKKSDPGQHQEGIRPATVLH